MIGSFIFIGVYADEDDVKKKLSEKYGKLSASELKGNKDFNEDLLASDINLTVRLHIVYSKLSIRSVRGAFEDSVGSRLQKFGGPNNKELLQRYVISQVLQFDFFPLITRILSSIDFQTVKIKATTEQMPVAFLV